MSTRLLTARQVADLLGVKSPETPLRWTREGKLRAYKLPSGAIRYREDELEATIEGWATTERGGVADPAGRRPLGNLAPVADPIREED